MLFELSPGSLAGPQRPVGVRVTLARSKDWRSGEGDSAGFPGCSSSSRPGGALWSWGIKGRFSAPNWWSQSLLSGLGQSLDHPHPVFRKHVVGQTTRLSRSLFLSVTRTCGTDRVGRGTRLYWIHYWFDRTGSVLCASYNAEPFSLLASAPLPDPHFLSTGTRADAHCEEFAEFPVQVAASIS